MKAPIGAMVSIYYDGLTGEGEFLKTGTGRLYQVIEMRVQQRGKYARRRRHLRCLVVDEMPEDATVRPLRWYPRSRR